MAITRRILSIGLAIALVVVVGFREIGADEEKTGWPGDLEHVFSLWSRRKRGDRNECRLGASAKGPSRPHRPRQTGRDAGEP